MVDESARSERGPAIARAPRAVPGTTRLPRLAYAGITIGTVVAVWLVPADPQPKEALFYSALAMTLGLAIAPVVASLSDPKAFLRGEHLLMLAPVYWLLLDPLQAAYPFDSIGQDDARLAFLAIAIFVSALWVGSLQRAWRAPAFVMRAASSELSPNTYFRVTLVAFVLGMLKFAIPCNFNLIEMFSYVGNSRWDAPWSRGQFGGWDAFQDHLQYFGYLLPALTVVLARRSGWLSAKAILSGCMSVIMALFLSQGGGRRIIGVIFGMALVLWILTQTRLRTRHLATVGASAALLLATLQFMLTYRNVGLGAAFGGDEAVVNERDYLHVDDNLLRFCQIIQLIPESYPYVYHRYVVWVLVRPIPRVLWPSKPADPGFDLPTALGVTGVSYSSSVLGELYMSGGLIAVAAGGWLFGRLAGVASRLLTQGPTFGAALVYSAMMMALFAGMRSMLELVLMSYVVVAWAALSSFAQRHRVRSARERTS